MKAPPKPDMTKAERCCRLLVRLALGDTVTASWAAREFGVHRRSIERDLEVVNRVLPIEFECSGRTWRKTAKP